MIYSQENIKNSNKHEKFLIKQYEDEVREERRNIYKNVIKNLTHVISNIKENYNFARETLADPKKTAMYIDANEQLEFYKIKLQELSA